MSLNLSGYLNFRLIRGGSFMLLVAVLISGCGSNPRKALPGKTTLGLQVTDLPIEMILRIPLTSYSGIWIDRKK